MSEAVPRAQSKIWANMSDDSSGGEEQNPQQHQHDQSHTDPTQKSTGGFRDSQQNQEQRAPRGENDIQEFGRGGRGRGRGGRGKNYQDRNFDNQGGFKERENRGNYRDNNDNPDQTDNRGYRGNRDNGDNGGYRGGRGGYRGNRDNNDNRGGYNKDRRDRRDNDGDFGGNSRGGYNKRDGNRNQNRDNDFEQRPQNSGDYQLPKHLQDLQARVKDFKEENIKVKVRHSKVSEQDLKDSMIGFKIVNIEYIDNEGIRFPVLIMDKESTIEMIKMKQLKLNIDHHEIHLDLIQFPEAEYQSPPAFKFVNSKVTEKPVLVSSLSETAQTEEVQVGDKTDKPTNNEVKSNYPDQNQILRRKEVDQDRTKPQSDQIQDTKDEKKDNYQGEYKNKRYDDKKWDNNKNKPYRTQDRDRDYEQGDRAYVKKQDQDGNNAQDNNTHSEKRYVKHQDGNNNRNYEKKNDIQEFFGGDNKNKKFHNQDKKRNEDDEGQSPYVKKSQQSQVDNGEQKKQETKHVSPQQQQQTKPKQKVAQNQFTSKNPFSLLS